MGLVAFGILGAVMLASAQQIIGGHALDANQRVGSNGINGRSPRANAPGLSQPMYNPGLRSPVANRGSAGGIQQPVYWTMDTPAPARAQPRGFGATNGGATYATSAGSVYDPLAAPLYRPLSKPVQVQTGAGTLEVNTGQQTVSERRYRPLR